MWIAQLLVATCFVTAATRAPSSLGCRDHCAGAPRSGVGNHAPRSRWLRRPRRSVRGRVDGGGSTPAPRRGWYRNAAGTDRAALLSARRRARATPLGPGWTHSQRSWQRGRSPCSNSKDQAARRGRRTAVSRSTRSATSSTSSTRGSLIALHVLAAPPQGRVLPWVEQTDEPGLYGGLGPPRGLLPSERDPANGRPIRVNGGGTVSRAAAPVSGRAARTPLAAPGRVGAVVVAVVVVLLAVAAVALSQGGGDSTNVAAPPTHRRGASDGRRLFHRARLQPRPARGPSRFRRRSPTSAAPQSSSTSFERKTSAPPRPGVSG